MRDGNGAAGPSRAFCGGGAGGGKGSREEKRTIAGSEPLRTQRDQDKLAPALPPCPPRRAKRLATRLWSSRPMTPTQHSPRSRSSSPWPNAPLSWQGRDKEWLMTPRHLVYPAV